MWHRQGRGRKSLILKGCEPVNGPDSEGRIGAQPASDRAPPPAPGRPRPRGQRSITKEAISALPPRYWLAGRTKAPMISGFPACDVIV